MEESGACADVLGEVGDVVKGRCAVARRCDEVPAIGGETCCVYFSAVILESVDYLAVLGFQRMTVQSLEPVTRTVELGESPTEKI